MGEANQAGMIAVPFFGDAPPSRVPAEAAPPDIARAVPPGIPPSADAPPPTLAPQVITTPLDSDTAEQLAAARGRGLRLPAAITATVGPLLDDHLALLDERAVVADSRSSITHAATRAGRPDPLHADRRGARPTRTEPPETSPPGAEQSDEVPRRARTDARHRLPELINRLGRLTEELDALERSASRQATTGRGHR